MKGLRAELRGVQTYCCPENDSIGSKTLQTCVGLHDQAKPPALAPPAGLTASLGPRSWAGSLVSEMPRPALDANGDGTLRSRAGRRAARLRHHSSGERAGGFVPDVGAWRAMRRVLAVVSSAPGKGSPCGHCPDRRREVTLEGDIGSASILPAEGMACAP